MGTRRPFRLLVAGAIAVLWGAVARPSLAADPLANDGRDDGVRRWFEEALRQQQPYFGSGGVVGTTPPRPAAGAAPPRAPGAPSPIVIPPPAVEMPADRQVGETRIVTEPDYWRNYYRVPWRMVTAPADWDAGDWIKGGLVVGVTGGALLADRGIKNWVQDNKKGSLTSAARLTQHLGDAYTGWIAFPALYVAGAALGHDKTAETGLLGLQAWALAGVGQQAIKFASHRHRPNTAKDQWQWDGPSSSGSNLSFVSGHATFVWSGATVIANQYDDPWHLVPITAYTLATLTSWARVYNNKHWASDAVVGAALGWGIGKTVVLLSPWRDDRVAVTPRAGTDEVGVVLTVKF